MIRMSMASKFRLGAGVSIFMVIFLGLFSIYHLHFLNEEIQTQLTDDLVLIRFADDAGSLCSDAQFRVTSAYQTSSPEKLREIVSTLDKGRHRLERLFDMPPARKASMTALLDDLGAYSKAVHMVASEPISPLPESLAVLTARHQKFLEKLSTFVSST